jgi:RNA polymerase sigma-70 factor (ECF subfamily)
MTEKDFNTAVDLYADGIYRFAFKHTKNEMSAKDVVQETFAKVWAKHKDISFEKIKSYLFTTAYHLILDFFKQESRTTDFSGIETVSVANTSVSFDLQAILNEALDKLPTIQKTVVLLRDYEGYNYAEIAKITALNESQVKVYIFRARQALKAYIKELETII